MRIVAKGEQGLSSTYDILSSNDPPPYPACDQYWLDGNFNPPKLKQYNCETEQWELVQMDATELDPDTFEDIDEKIEDKHKEVLDEVKRIDEDAANLKKQVEDNHERDTKYFEEVWKNIDEVEADLQQTNDDLQKTNDDLYITNTNMHNMNIKLSDEIAEANDDIIANRGEYLGLYGDINGKHSILAQNVNGIAARVSNSEGDISQLTLTSKSFGTRITDAEKNISTISQDAKSIGLRVSDSEKNISTLTVDTKAIATRVSNAEGNISTVTQSANALAVRLTSAEGNITSLTTTANGLAVKIEDNRKNVATVTATATALGTRLTTAEGNISSVIQTASSLSSKISTVEGNYSSLVQTVNGMQSTVTSITNGTHSTIKQMADNISLRVEKNKVVSQINASTEGVYIAGKLIYLDSNVTVSGTFTAPKVISANSNNTEYTKIENRTLTSYGYHSGTWRGGYYAGNHELVANVGYIKMQQLDGTYAGSKPALYYTSRGISTYFGANNSASGSIEFFSPSYSASVRGLLLSSSGNIMLESTASSGSHIFINPNGGKLHVCDKYMSSYYDVVCGTIDAGTLKAGQFYTNTTNFNSSDGSIKIGGTTGNINIQGTMTCSKVTETSKRELKKNIELYTDNAVDVINTASIKTYQYLNDVDNVDLPYVGLILDEAPLEVVDTRGEGVLVAQGTWMAWKAIQELSNEVNELKAELSAMKNK